MRSAGKSHFGIGWWGPAPDWEQQGADWIRDPSVNSGTEIISSFVPPIAFATDKITVDKFWKCICTILGEIE